MPGKPSVRYRGIMDLALRKKLLFALTALALASLIFNAIFVAPGPTRAPAAMMSLASFLIGAIMLTGLLRGE